MLAHALAPQGHRRVKPGPQAMAVVLEVRQEMGLGFAHPDPGWLAGLQFPKMATRGQQAPSAEEFLVAQVMAS